MAEETETVEEEIVVEEPQQEEEEKVKASEPEAEPEARELVMRNLDSTVKVYRAGLKNLRKSIVKKSEIKQKHLEFLKNFLKKTKS